MGGVSDAASQAPDEGEVMPFGQALVAQGLVSAEEVERTVGLQGQLARRGVFLRLGELLVARGVLDQETVSRVLELQGTVILVCPQCLAQFNAIAYHASRAYSCSRCGEGLRKATELEDVAVEDTLVHSDWADAFELREGHTFGNYEILGLISRGGMGIVYKARQRGLDRIVALKVMADPDARPEDREAFRQEARAVAALRHPNIVAIHEVGRVGDVDFYSMDYVEGLQLQRAVASEGLNARDVVVALVEVCDAVAYANGQGILHRDLKPQNILVDRHRRPILIDFGIAGDEREPGTSEPILGSPAYLPPEYISGTGGYDRRGEVYALGATLYTVLAGRPPHSGIDTVQILRQVRHGKVVPIRSLRRSIDRDLATIVMTALSAGPESRYASVGDLASDLRRWLGGDEVAGQASPLQRLWQLKRGKVAATVGLAVALLLPVSTGLLSLRIRELDRQLEEEQRQGERQRHALQEALVSARLELARARAAAGDREGARSLLDQLHALHGLAAFRGRIETARRELLEGEPQGE